MNEELKKIIKKSGNNVHMRTVEKLEQVGWTVGLSSYYYDDTTNIPREIDIVAEKQYGLKGTGDNFLVSLFMECKYFKQEIAFRMHSNTQGKTAIKIKGVNLDEVLEQDSDLGRKHHYIEEPSVGKLYDTKNDTDRTVFNAITQPIKSLIFFRDHGKDKVAMYYPIVLYDGIEGFYCVERYNIAGKDLDALSPMKNTLFGVKYSYKNVLNNDLKTEDFCIDFIHESELGFLLDVIEKEASEVQKALELRYFKDSDKEEQEKRDTEEVQKKHIEDKKKSVGL